MSDLLVKKLESSWIPGRQIAVLEATKKCTAVFGSIAGDKCFYMKQGERVRLRVPTTNCWEVGDKVKFENVITPFNQTKFSWKWA